MNNLLNIENCSEIDKLYEQLSYAKALNSILEAILRNDDTNVILATMIEIIGSTLQVDRTSIYDIDFSRYQSKGLCEWLNPNTPNVSPTNATYSFDLFIDGNTYMKNTHQWLESHFDHYSPYALKDGSGDLLHIKMGIKSGLWYPFSFRENGHYCLVFNQVNHRRTWRREEINFIADVSKHVEIALQKINFINEQKHAEAILRLSEERFFKSFHYSPVAMTITSLESGKFIDVNENSLLMHGYSKKEFIGHTSLELNLWADLKDYYKFHRILREKGFVHNLEILSYKKSGELFAALFSGVMIDLNGEKCCLTTKSDITDLKHYQREISRLDSLSLIGEMAAGIAHEVRNPMTTVKGFLQLLGEKSELKTHKNTFYLMIDELDRANSIITEFLSLVKNKPVNLQRQDLNLIIQSLYPLIQADALVTDKNIELELNPIDDLLGDDHELRQLIINVVRNGLEAMSAGGKLTIKTLMEDHKIVLVIKDQGIGIPPQAIDKIGTPFFTTKDNGTGLGLATCYSIVVRHNASINFDTCPTGTTFYIRFNSYNL